MFACYKYSPFEQMRLSLSPNTQQVYARHLEVTVQTGHVCLTHEHGREYSSMAL